MSAPAFAEPLGADAIRAAMAERRIVSWRTTADVTILLPWHRIETLRRSDAIAPGAYYLGFQGGAVPSAAYRDGNGRLRFAVVEAFLNKGASLVIDGIERHVPAIGSLAAAIAAALDMRVGANAYLTFGAVSVFAPHEDAHDVLALQLHGAKRWQVGAPAPADIVLEPGTFLFVPRGVRHEAIPLALPSVHLSFGLTSLPR